LFQARAYPLEQFWHVMVVVLGVGVGVLELLELLELLKSF